MPNSTRTRKAKKATAKRTPAKKAKAPARKRTTKAKPAKRRTTAKRRPAKKAPAKKAPARRAPTNAEDAIVYIPVSKLRPSPENERQTLEGIDELADSIREVGIVEPIIVLPADKNGIHELVVGHRRLAGAKKARLGKAPCIVKDLDEAGRAEHRLIENLQRHEIRPTEEARGYEGLIRLGWTQTKIAERVGRSQGTISKRLGLLELPDPALKALHERRITVDDAEKLTRLKDHPDRIIAILKDDEGDVEWVVDQELRELEGQAAATKLVAKLEKAGITVIPADATIPAGAKPVRDYGGITVDAKRHRKEPCHVVRVHTSWGSAEEQPYCTEPARHAAKGDSKLKVKKAAGASEKQKAEMKARKEAANARKIFIVDNLKRKPDRATTLELVARRFVDNASWADAKLMAAYLELDLVDDGVGPDPDLTIRRYVDAGEPNLLRACVARMFVHGEDGRASQADHLRYLERLGYQPTETERADAKLAAAEDQALNFDDEERDSRGLAEQRMANDHAAAERVGLTDGDEVHDDGAIQHADGTTESADDVRARTGLTSWPDVDPAELNGDTPPPVDPGQQTLDEPPAGEDDDGYWDAQRARLAGDDETAEVRA